MKRTASSNHVGAFPAFERPSQPKKKTSSSMMRRNRNSQSMGVNNDSNNNSFAPKIMLNYSALTQEQIMEATNIFNDEDGSAASIDVCLEKLALMRPNSYDLDQTLEMLGYEANSSYLEVEAFLHILNEVWLYYQSFGSEKVMTKNAYDAVQQADMEGGNHKSEVLQEDYELDYYEQEGVNAFQIGAGKSKDVDELQAVSEEALAADPIAVILETHGSKSFKQFTKMLSRTGDDPELVKAFVRLGAEETDIGFFLDSDVLERRCAATGLSDSETRAILNIFDEDSNGEIDFDEFKEVMVGDRISSSITDGVLTALKRLLGRGEGGSRNNLNRRGSSFNRASSGRRSLSAARMSGNNNKDGDRDGKQGGRGGQNRGKSMSLMDCIDLTAGEMLDEMQNGEFTVEDEKEFLEQLTAEIEDCEMEVQDFQQHVQEAQRIEELAERGAYATHYNRNTGEDESMVAPSTPEQKRKKKSATNNGTNGTADGGGKCSKPPNFEEMPLRAPHPRHKQKKYEYIPIPPNVKLEQKKEQQRKATTTASSGNNSEAGGSEAGGGGGGGHRKQHHQGQEVSPRYLEQLHEDEQFRVIRQNTTERKTIFGVPLPPVLPPSHTGQHQQHQSRAQQRNRANVTISEEAAAEEEEKKKQREGGGPVEESSIRTVESRESSPRSRDGKRKDSNVSTATSGGGGGGEGGGSPRSKKQASFKNYTETEPSYCAPTKRGSHRFLMEMRKENNHQDHPANIEKDLYEKALNKTKFSPRLTLEAIGQAPTTLSSSAHANNADATSTASSKKAKQSPRKLEPLPVHRAMNKPLPPESIALPYAVKAVVTERELRDGTIPRTARVGDGGSFKQFVAAASGVYGPLSARIGPMARDKAKPIKSI